MSLRNYIQCHDVFITPKEIDPDLSVSVQESPVEAMLAVAWCRVRGTECSSASTGPFEGSHHYLHYLHHSLDSGQIAEREHSPVHQQKIGLKIYWTWPHQSKQDSISPSVSPIRKLCTMLCSGTKNGQIMVESSDKTWSTGEGNGKPLQYSCLKNPIKSMKRQKDRTPEVSLL